MTWALIMRLALAPTAACAVFLLVRLGAGELHVLDVWGNSLNLPLGLGYLVVVSGIYMGLMTWLASSLVALAGRLGLKWFDRIATSPASLRLWVAWLVVGPTVGLLGIPFMLTRAHALYSIIYQLGSVAYLVGTALATLSAYGLFRPLLLARSSVAAGRGVNAGDGD